MADKAGIRFMGCGLHLTKHQVGLISRTDDLRLKESITIELIGAEASLLSLDHRHGLVGWFGKLKRGGLLA
jgi:hypothetical protein